MLWMVVLSVFSALTVLFLLGRINELAIKRDWDLLLTPKAVELFRHIQAVNDYRSIEASFLNTQRSVLNEFALVDLTYEEAFAVRELGSVDEAKHLIDVGYKVIEKF